MIRGSRPLSVMLLGAALASGVGVACASHPYRVYDPYYTDYHVWNNDEVVYYNRWSAETHRDPHRDFRHLNKDEQKGCFSVNSMREFAILPDEAHLC